MSEPLPSRLRVIVIGASAGGVDALMAIAAHLPTTLPVPVLVVLHLPADRPSGIVALLASRCALPVEEALDKAPLKPGTLVVAPPDYHLLVEPSGTTFAVGLSADAPVRFSRPAIDPLFESAAEAHGSGVLAILLTGASDDGSEGVLAVRRRGGKAWIQDPATAAASTMPASALTRAGADAVLTLDMICRQLSLIE